MAAAPRAFASDDRAPAIQSDAAYQTVFPRSLPRKAYGAGLLSEHKIISGYDSSKLLLCSNQVSSTGGGDNTPQRNHLWAGIAASHQGIETKDASGRPIAFDELRATVTRRIRRWPQKEEFSDWRRFPVAPKNVFQISLRSGRLMPKARSGTPQMTQKIPQARAP
jgi:hypothetical protein